MPFIFVFLIFRTRTTIELRGAIFNNYNANWKEMVKELVTLVTVSGATVEDIKLYMKGLNDSFPTESRARLCGHLNLDPADFPELYRYHTDRE